MRIHHALATLLCALSVSSAGAQMGTFVDRQVSTDLRFLTYNPFFDHIFPDVSSTDAAKFQRIVEAVAPDVINLQEINRSASDVANLLNSIAPLPGGGLWNTYKGRDNVIASPYSILDTRPRTTPAGERDLAIGRVDLPDQSYARDFYIMNNHYACCGGGEPGRQQQSDALVNWMRDAKTVGEFVDLPGQTPMAVLGDLNIVGGPQPLQTVITGNIIDESQYGSDAAPDWDGSPLLDAQPLHNGVGPADYTWRNDGSPFDPGRLDYVIFTDSLLDLAHSYVLNTRDMSAAELSATGLMADDVVLNPSSNRFDHLPLVTDFRMATIEQIGDLSQNGTLDAMDLVELQQAIVNQTDQLRYDLNGDRVLNTDDVNYWVTEIFDTLLGDANLDRVVDGRDFLAWNSGKFTSTNWFGGDFNSDGVADAQDFNIWNMHKFNTASNVVPEPVVCLLGWLMAVALALRPHAPVRSRRLV